MPTNKKKNETVSTVKKTTSNMVAEKRTPSKAPAPAAQAKRETTVSQEAIARTAYFLWQKNGSPAGQEVHHWLEAERQLKKQR